MWSLHCMHFNGRGTWCLHLLLIIHNRYLFWASWTVTLFLLLVGWCWLHLNEFDFFIHTSLCDSCRSWRPSSVLIVNFNEASYWRQLVFNAVIRARDLWFYLHYWWLNFISRYETCLVTLNWWTVNVLIIFNWSFWRLSFHLKWPLVRLILLIWYFAVVRTFLL